MRNFSIPVALMFLGLSLPALAADAPPEKTYTAKCAACHGKDGKGNKSAKPVVPQDLTASKSSDADKEKAITEGAKNKEGKEVMKGFKDKLSPEAIKALVTYVDGLKK